MRSVFILAFCTIVCGAAFSQNKKSVQLRGTVTDSATATPLPFAAISISEKDSKKALTGAITDSTGKFTIDDAAEGIVTVTIECIGYKAKKINGITIAKGAAAADLGIIKLTSVATSMESVTVTARINTIENKIDRMVFNAEKDISSQTGTAADVLKKVPQVAVDADGNVQLAGSAGIRFLINGRPSTAFGSNVADVLQSIPASQIKSIEVITNPGAKYDAQGLGGIINIILKSNKTKGYNGSLSLTAGTRQENGSFNFNVRNNNFGMNAFVSGNKRIRSTVLLSSERNTTTPTGIDFLKQDAVSSFERHGLQTGAGFDWTASKKNSFSGNIYYSIFGNKGSGVTVQDFEADKGSTLPPVFTQINSSSKTNSHNTDISLNYKRGFSKKDRELEIDFSTGTEHERINSFNDQLILPQQSISSGTKSYNPGKAVETEISIDYTDPFSENIIFGTGGKLNFYDINSNSSALKFDRSTQDYIPDPSLQTNVNYKQKVYAAYAELSFPLFSGITGKAGSRYERTEINAFFSNAQQQRNVPGYNTLVPSIYLSKKIDDKQSMKLSYSKRIERPDYNDLNPFVNTTDPKNLSTGNTNLLPEIGHRIELSYNRDFGKTGTAMINLFYRINENDIQPYLKYYQFYNVGDSVYTDVSVSTRQNIGSEKNMGANIFGDLHPTSKLGLRGNLFMFHRHTINVIDKGFNTNSFNYRFNINANYRFTPTLVSEFFGNFNSARHEAQGIYPSFTTYTFAIRKEFWNKKGSLALTANNFFRKYVDQETRLFGPGYDAVSLRQIPFRSIGVNFAWRFGKLEFKKEPVNDNNAGGGE